MLFISGYITECILYYNPDAGFRRISLGPRILRTDTAVVALLALLSGTADSV